MRSQNIRQILDDSCIGGAVENRTRPIASDAEHDSHSRYRGDDDDDDTNGGRQLPIPITVPAAGEPPPSPFTSAPRPRDARMLELLMTSQGVTSYEARVPLLLMDFAYRHTSAVLNDALHLTVDPHTSHAGTRAASTAGATATLIGADATVSANAVRLAIASRQGYQFRGGNNSGGLSKEWLQELAKERNKRFVLSGLSWGLKDVWADENSSGDEDEEMEDALGGNTGTGAMDGIEAPDLDDVEAEGYDGRCVWR
ncbi:unnamed protein product [Parascedosporium putredinis]|uniref:Transcription initiation factor TFIID subunit 9 n=1 Tax=Parascedosporium putredinis TaxID=1442378 RepID=A0A9P1H889_9PEZI|nr:unnamed protein product [Parascedosporium putredinis]CAI8002142.1 unnamed protein product [Parascedosporium putredinis]